MWTVAYTSKARKSIRKLPRDIVEIFYVLIREIQHEGPYRMNWKNYGKLRGSKNRFHCHLDKGKPTYVTCWEIKDKKIKLIEVNYVGSHEKAPY